MLTSCDTRWRAIGPYLPNNSSKTGLVAETRQFLLTYERLGTVEAVRQALVDGELPHRSRTTRVNIVRTIQERLTRWNSPGWVLAELVEFARDDCQPSLQAALLLHVVRQDRLLYDVVQQLIVPRWTSGERVVIRADVQRFLDQAVETHPEVGAWRHETREKLAGNLLTILRDYGLLQGTARKHIVEPVVPPEVAGHLVRLLRAEGVAESELAHHPDWKIWLWDVPRARVTVSASAMVEGAR